MCSADHFNLLKDVSLDLDVQIEANPDKSANPNSELATATGYTAMFDWDFDNIIEITKERQVLVYYKL